VLDEKQSVILEQHVHIIALDGDIDTSCEQGYGVEVWNHIFFLALPKHSLIQQL